MRTRSVLFTLLLVCSVGSTGCISSLRLKNQTRSRVTSQASSLPDIYYQEVLNNLAMVPKDAAYVGQFGKTYVWVTKGNLENLTRLTLAILDIHTFRSERIGGSRVQPGILPR